MVLVLSGPVHGGKTTFLERSWPVWAGRGLACSGFLSPAADGGPAGAGYDLLEIPSGRRRPYLRRGGGPGTERIGPYVFVPEALDRAREILRAAGPPGLLIVDEVGPLELRGGGIWPALREALAAPGRRLLVIRREIVDRFAALIAPRRVRVFDLGEAAAPRLLEAALFERSPADDGQS